MSNPTRRRTEKKRVGDMGNRSVRNRSAVMTTVRRQDLMRMGATADSRCPQCGVPCRDRGLCRDAPLAPLALANRDLALRSWVPDQARPPEWGRIRNLIPKLWLEVGRLWRVALCDRRWRHFHTGTNGDKLEGVLETTDGVAQRITGALARPLEFAGNARSWEQSKDHFDRSRPCHFAVIAPRNGKPVAARHDYRPRSPAS
jgi:hypothetical protein